MKEDFIREYDGSEEASHMVDRRKKPLVLRDKPKLKLTGQDGNAFSILARMSRAGKDAGWDKAYRDEVQREATNGDYDKLLATAIKYFDCR